MTGAKLVFPRSRDQAPDAVGVKPAVGAEHGDALNQCLCHDHPIKRIAMEQRQGAGAQSMGDGDRERRGLGQFQSGWNVICRRDQQGGA